MLDITIPTPKGAVYAMYFKQNVVEQGEYANGAMDGELKLTIKQAHDHLGHIGKDAIHKCSFWLAVDTWNVACM